jgi:hypothetical protein
MAVKCLQNFIGVKCIGEPTPRSGYYINQLEGLSLRLASDVADSDYLSGVALLKDKIALATDLVVSDIAPAALKFFRVNTLVDSIQAGIFSLTYLIPANVERGLQIEVRRSRLLRNRVNKVKIKIQEANFAHQFKIVDGSNETIYSFVTDSKGEAEVFPNYLSEEAKIFIVMENDFINVNDTDIKEGCGCSSITGRNILVHGWNGSSTSSSSYGLQVEIAAECSQDQLACIISSRLGFPILYRSGLEIVKEALTTDRLNSVTLLNRERLEILHDLFTKEYESQLRRLIESLPELLKRLDDCCINCNQSRYVYGTP